MGQECIRRYPDGSRLVEGQRRPRAPGWVLGCCGLVLADCRTARAASDPAGPDVCHARPLWGDNGPNLGNRAEASLVPVGAIPDLVTASRPAPPWQSDHVIEGGRLLDEFRSAATRFGLLGPEGVLTHEHLPAPHRPPSKLPLSATAVYVFSLSPTYGATCAAGPNRVLKVGKVGAKSAPRFCSQHYLPGSSRSNLAKSLLNERVLWHYLGIEQLDDGGIKAWMCEHLDRDHIFIVGQPGLERQVERYFRGRLGPAFEG